MAENVYILPNGLVMGSTYGDQFRVAAEVASDGELIAVNEIAARASFRISGRAKPGNFAAFRTFRDRMRGGIGIAGLVDREMRKTFGWDRIPAINSSGAEFWRANGRTAGYAGEAANPPTGPYRSINASVVGAHSAGDTTIDVDGLLAGEVIPAGCTAKFGDWRHVITTAATADGSGAATLTISTGIRDPLADNDPVRVPGDFMLARVVPGTFNTSETGLIAVAEFSAEFREVYASEVVGGLGTYILP